MDPDARIQDKVPRMVDEAQFHCWRLNDEDELIEKLERRVAELEATIKLLVGPTPVEKLAELQAPQIAAERKRTQRTKVTETA
jgi:hypothetical protein